MTIISVEFLQRGYVNQQRGRERGYEIRTIRDGAELTLGFWTAEIHF